MNENQASTLLRLDGWKAIALHLGRSVRTVQRWQAEYQCPVHHVGGRKGSVFAFDDELHAWMLEHRITSSDHESEAELSSEFAVLRRADADHVVPLHFRRRSAQLAELARGLLDQGAFENRGLIAKLLRDAVDLDPSNVMAWAGLSYTMVLGAALGCLGSATAFRIATAALETAISIDPQLHDGWCAGGWIKLLIEKDWQGARIEFDNCLERDPRSPHALSGKGLLGIAQGNLVQATEFFLEAAGESRSITSPMALYCWTQYLAGNYAQSLDGICDLRHHGDSGAVLDAVEALSSVLSSRSSECLRRLTTLLSSSWDGEVLRGAMGYVYAISGDSLRARDTLRRLSCAQKGTHRCYYAMAITHVGLGEKQNAVKRLKQSCRAGELWSIGFRSDPILAPLRSQPEYQQLFDSTRI